MPEYVNLLWSPTVEPTVESIVESIVEGLQFECRINKATVCWTIEWNNQVETALLTNMSYMSKAGTVLLAQTGRFLSSLVIVSDDLQCDSAVDSTAL